MPCTIIIHNVLYLTVELEGGGIMKALTFSYDDGIEQDRRLVAIFNKYGMKATFNLNTGIQSNKSWFEINNIHIQRMEQEGLKDLYKGHEIAVHGLKHLSPVELDASQYRQEFITDAENIEKLYGQYPCGMAYAYGTYNDEVITYLKNAGFKYGRTTGVTHSFKMPEDPLRLESTCHHDDKELFALAEKFLNAAPPDDERMLFYIWGHSYEFEVNNNWDRIEQLCEMLGGRDDIFYGTNSECLCGQWK